MDSGGETLFDPAIQVNDEGEGVIELTDDQAFALGLVVGGVYDIFLSVDETGHTIVEFELVEMTEAQEIVFRHVMIEGEDDETN